MTRTVRLLATGIQLCIAIITLFVFIGVAAWLRSERINAPNPPGPTIVFLEHEDRTALILRISRRGSGGVLELQNNGTTEVYFSVPDAWERTEVRGVPLQEVAADTPAANYTRWSIPASAQVQWIASVLPPLMLQHTADIPIALTVTRINLDTNAAENDTVLLTDEQYPL